MGLYSEIFKDKEYIPIIDDVINYGALLRKSKQLKEASLHYKQYLDLFANDITLIQNACNCWIELKDFEQSRVVLGKALEKDFENTALLLSLGFTEISAGNKEKACKIFERILDIDSNNFDAWFNLAVAKAKLGSFEDALRCFRNADQRQNNNYLLKANIITILQEQKKINEAWKELDKLNSAARSSKEVKAVEASLLMTEERYTEASHILKDLCDSNPLNAKHWLNWSNCLKALKYTVAPKEIIKTALLWNPKNIDLRHSFAQSMAEMGSIKSYEKTDYCWEYNDIELNSEHIFSRQFLAISSDKISHQKRKELAQNWERNSTTPQTNQLWADRIQDTNLNRPIKVAYMSSDWRNHPVGRFMLPILKSHNKKEVEIYIIDSTPNHDWISDQLKKHADHWLGIKHLNGLQAARLISDQKIDIMVELGGFTGNSRLDCLVHRPCPIQISYLGYPAPTYLKCIDGWIGDKQLFSTLTSDERDAHQLFYIEGGYMAFDAGTGIPEVKCEHSDNFRFGCFNHARKLTNQTIALFSKILKECPRSKLVLKSISFHEEAERERIREKFKVHAIEPKRLIVMDWVPGGLGHLSCYNQIDAALDPFPYGGATTTAEALWMGVPVVTQRHSGMAGCLSTSLLSFSNQRQWIADTEQEYLKITKELFSLGRRGDKDRIKLRSAVQRSPLSDAKRLSQELESLYRRLVLRNNQPFV